MVKLLERRIQCCFKWMHICMHFDKLPTEVVQRIKRPHICDFRKFAKRLNGIWRSLGRKFDAKVKENPDLFPVLPVPHAFVVPGGFFQIYFYWDSYWIIKGYF